MASSNKTETLGLNQWLGTDKPKRDDFNADNLAIDQAVKNLQESVDMAMGSYTGTGIVSGRFIEFGFRPKAVFIWSAGRVFNSTHIFYASYTGQENSNFTLFATGVAISNSVENDSDGQYTRDINQEGRTYYYLALRETES